ncbi:MAG: 16S rRNA (cytosine(967)-C(5))-methyltransferase RsmB, partial [Candidatus Eisenbacteria bacterium]
RPPRFARDDRGSKFQRDDRSTSRPRRDDGDRGSFDPRVGRRFAAPEQRYDAKTGRAIEAGGATATERPRSTKPGQTGGAPSATSPKRGTNVRDLALQVLFQVQTKRAFAERVIEDLAEQMKLDRRDRGFMNELVKGTLRHRATLDWHLGRFLHVGLASTPVWIQNALRLGAYQLIHLDRIPPRAAVDETVKLALKYGHPGTAGLANSVLRRLAEAVSMGDLAMPSPTRDDGTPDWEALTAITSHPRWLLERWVPRYGIDGTLALCNANNRHARLGLRANRLRLDRKELLKRLEDAGLAGEAGRWSSHTVWVEADADFSDFPAYARGDCTVQDESETMVSQLLAPKPGERVLDLCAAPGGKTTHLAELMGDSGEIVAVEKMAPRARTMKKQVDRLGVKTVTIEVADGTTANLLSMGAGGLYDRALVDAPCSGLGVLARRADARWRKEASLFEEMADVQAKLLRAAAEVVRPGGTLVYSVCSFEPEETDAIVASFLAGHPEWTKEHAATTLPKDLVEEGGSMRILPHVHGVDGAFAVRLVRSKDEKAGV